MRFVNNQYAPCNRNSDNYTPKPFIPSNSHSTPPSTYTQNYPNRPSSSRHSHPTPRINFTPAQVKVVETAARQLAAMDAKTTATSASATTLA